MSLFFVVVVFFFVFFSVTLSVESFFSCGWNSLVNPVWLSFQLQAVLGGFLAGTTVVHHLAQANDEEALVQIQQMQGVISSDLASIDGRTADSGSIVNPQESKNGAAAAKDMPVQREIYARVGSAVYGCSESRTGKATLKPVLTVKAQIREMFVGLPSRLWLRRVPSTCFGHTFCCLSCTSPHPASMMFWVDSCAAKGSMLDSTSPIKSVESMRVAIGLGLGLVLWVPC